MQTQNTSNQKLADIVFTVDFNFYKLARKISPVYEAKLYLPSFSVTAREH